MEIRNLYYLSELASYLIKFFILYNNKSDILMELHSNRTVIESRGYTIFFRPKIKIKSNR